MRYKTLTERQFAMLNSRYLKSIQQAYDRGESLLSSVFSQFHTKMSNVYVSKGRRQWKSGKRQKEELARVIREATNIVVEFRDYRGELQILFTIDTPSEADQLYVDLKPNREAFIQSLYLLIGLIDYHTRRPSIREFDHFEDAYRHGIHVAIWPSIEVILDDFFNCNRFVRFDPIVMEINNGMSTIRVAGRDSVYDTTPRYK